MFGSLGVPELLLIFVVILLVFGPRRIPEIGRTLGKALGEFRKTTDDLKSTIEREVRLEELKKITPPSLESLYTPSESVSRSEPVVEELQPTPGAFAELPPEEHPAAIHGAPDTATEIASETAPEPNQDETTTAPESVTKQAAQSE